MNAIDIANYIILYAMDNGSPVTNLKLQKLLYFVQGAMLVLTEEPAFNEEIVAWQYGPVVPSVYFMYASYGATPIFIETDNKSCGIPEEQRNIIDIVLTQLMPYSARQLVELTHEKGSPWADVYPEKSIISQESIKNYFTKYLRG